MSASLATPIARFDYRVRIAATLLRSAPRREHLVVAGMVLTSVAAAWPLGGVPVVVPAVLALAALIRHHLDGLDARRDALAAAGAGPADTLVIQITGPLGATGVGTLVGVIAAVVLGRPTTYALVPLVTGVVAGLVVRRAWLGAPALGTAALAALATAAMVRAGSPAPPVEVRSRLAAGHGAVSAWNGLWPTVLAALLVLAATQAAIVHRDRLRRLGRRVIAAAQRRPSARSSA